METFIFRCATLLLACSCFFSPVRAADEADLEGYFKDLVAADDLKDLQALHVKWEELITDPDGDALIARATAKATDVQIKTLLGISKETFSDARAKGAELATATLAVRLVLLEMYQCNTAEDVAELFRKHPDVTDMPNLKSAFSRLAKHPTVDENGLRLMEELYKAFLGANDNPDDAAQIVMNAVKYNQSGQWPDEEEPAPPDPEKKGKPTLKPKEKPAPRTDDPAPDKPKPAKNSPLVGHWENLSMEDGGTILTTKHLILDASGEFALWSVDDFPATEATRTSAKDLGTWSAKGGVLTLDYVGGQKEEINFEQSDADHLTMPKLGEFGKWTRTD